MPEEAEQEQEAAAQQAEEESQAKEAEEEEQQQEEDEPRDPSSTMVASWGYDREAEELQVVFQNGHEESYPCSPETWDEAKNASSAGKWMHANML